MARPLQRVGQRILTLHQRKRFGQIVLADLAVLERSLPEFPLRLSAPAIAQHHRQRDLALAKIVAHALSERRRLARIIERIVDQLAEFAAKQNAPIVAISAAIESEIAGLDDADREVFLADMGMEEPGLDRLIRAAFQLLGLQTYFTAGVKEVRAWTIHIGDTAPQAAGVIHTDFERGFIRAETVSYDDFIQYKGEAGAAQAGRLRKEGKDYIVKEGDVLHFLFNV